MYLNLTLNAQPFSNDVNRAIQNLDQVAAGVLLYHDRGHQHAQIGRGNAIQKLQQCVSHRQAEVQLLENFTEFRGGRFLCILSQHFQGPHHRMAGTQSAGQHVDASGRTALKVLTLFAHLKERIP